MYLESWPRLLSTKNKPGWLKIDFDKMDIEDSEAEESQAHLNVSSIISAHSHVQFCRNYFVNILMQIICYCML